MAVAVLCSVYAHQLLWRVCRDGAQQLGSETCGTSVLVRARCLNVLTSPELTDVLSDGWFA